MLNAFRHHCGQHTVEQVVTWEEESAQRLSASLRSTRRMAPGSFLGLPVLNAFRHHCGRHARPPESSPPPPHCAQRLSASLRSTLDRCSTNAELVRCSTPFGITAVNTRPKPVRTGDRPGAQRLSASLRSTHCHARHGPAETRVLNAFRHHCGQHRNSDSSRAVLNPCAQRLSASLRSTRAVDEELPLRGGVLNAFRHHCGQHLNRNKVGEAALDVLNAFRHHCGQHNRAVRTVPLAGSVLNAFRHHCGQHHQTACPQAAGRPVLNAFRHHCGQHVGGRDQDQVLRGVLNAIRHHCGQHARKSRIIPLGSRCSTPFGITAVNTRLKARSPAPWPYSAQRLSASLRSTQRLEFRGVAHRHVLNAFRHHCGQHIARSLHHDPPVRVLNAFRHHCGQHSKHFKVISYTKGAQRLSASLRSTRRRLLPSARAELVLNAFRHHCGQHFPGDLFYATWWPCSTPFGITAVNTPVRLIPMSAWA